MRKKALSLVRRLAKDISLGTYFPFVYQDAAKEAVVASKIVFLENKSNQLPDAYKVLYARLIEDYSFDVSFISLGQNRVRLRQYYYNCRDAVKEIATAKYVFLNDASDLISCLPLREETKVVQLWHACGAFKKWGMSTADLKFGGTREDLLRHPFYKNLSLVTVSSPEVSWAYVEAMVLEDRPEIVKPIGVSRTDVFFDEDRLIKARERINRFVPCAEGKRIILYAPTFRGRVASAQGPDQLDIERFKEAFGEDSVLLIKHHPFVKKPHSIPDGCEDFAYDVSGDLSIDELLCVADVCISDYSSLVFEYSLFEKPMVFFAYDIEDYGDWRGFYYDYDELTPGPVFSDNDVMIDYLQHLDERFDVERVRAFREKFMSACDGHATERICEEVFGDALETYRKPTALDILRAENPDGVDVSIVIPAYNAMPELTKTLESLVGQTYDLSRMEVIVTDDCSSDDTWDEVRRFAASYPDLFVLERLDKPSGSPAKPRNAGLEKARGTYVFFLDADDWLGEKAVEKMLDHAVEWDSDVLLVKMKGENGRDVPKSMFTHNQPKADVFTSKVMWSFAPLKLFRRSLVKDLRFPPFMPEDISFVLRAYCAAETVSVAADYEYYHVSWHESNRHISLATWDDVNSNLQAYRDIFGFVNERVSSDCRDAVLMRRLFRRDVYHSLLSAVRECPGISKVHVQSLVELAKPYYKKDMYATCPIPQRLVLEAAFSEDYPLLSQVALQGENLATRCVYDVQNGRIVCGIPDALGSLSFDVTDAHSLNCRVESISWSDDSMNLIVSALIPEAFKTAACCLVLERDNGVDCIELPMLRTSSGDSCKAESGIPCTRALWRAELLLDQVFDFGVDSAWKLGLRCEMLGWSQQSRLGPVRAVGVKKAFSSIAVTRGSMRLTGCLCSRGDLCLKLKQVW